MSFALIPMLIMAWNADRASRCTGARSHAEMATARVMFTLPTLIMGRVAPDHMQEGIAYRVQVQANHSTRVFIQY